MAASSRKATTALDWQRYWDWDRPEESEHRFNQMLLKVPEQGPLAGEILTQLARAQTLQKNWDQAGRNIDRAEECVDSESPSVVLILCFLERGRLLLGQGQEAGAKRTWLQAAELADEIDAEELAIEITYSLGTLPGEAPYKEDWWLKALGQAETAMEPRARRWITRLFQELGWFYFAGGRWMDAFVVFERDLAHLEMAKAEPELKREARWRMARVLRAMKRFDEAFRLQLELLAEWEADQRKSAAVFEELGELYLERQEFMLAKSFFVRAIEEHRKDPRPLHRDPRRWERLQRLSGCTL